MITAPFSDVALKKGEASYSLSPALWVAIAARFRTRLVEAVFSRPLKLRNERSCPRDPKPSSDGAPLLERSPSQCSADSRTAGRSATRFAICVRELDIGRSSTIRLRPQVRRTRYVE